MNDPFAELREVVRQLRSPEGCAWDREQTNASLAPALIEEACEVAAAIRAGDDPNLREELGDLLLVVLMHAQIAKEAARFDIDDAIRGATEKLIRRHPHVFGTSEVRDTAGILQQWDEIKRREKSGNASAPYLAEIPVHLPALMRAQKAQTKAARVNFDWSDVADVIAKIEEELAEVKAAMSAQDANATAEEIGDLLFAVTNLARKAKLDAESILQSATDKFSARFHLLEERVLASGRQLGDLDLHALDEIWDAVKTAGH